MPARSARAESWRSGARARSAAAAAATSSRIRRVRVKRSRRVSESAGVLADTGDEEPLAIHPLHDAHQMDDEDADPETEGQQADQAAKSHRHGTQDEADDRDGDPEHEFGHHQH